MRYLLTIPVAFAILYLTKRGELPRFRGPRLTRAGLSSLTILAHAMRGQVSAELCLSLMIAKVDTGT
nr:MAG TPA: hypothetical protein [Caudoviricetes sp.]